MIPTLRPYQVDTLNAIAGKYAEGLNRLLVKKPTGTGKTVTFAAIPGFKPIADRVLRFPQRGAFMLVIAHREELLEQAAAKIQAQNRGLIVDIEQGDRHASRYANVIVASIQTLAAGVPGRPETRFRRLRRLLTHHTFRIVIIDEAHHAAAASYRTTLVHLGFLPPADASDAENLEAADFDDVKVMEQALAGWDRMAPQDRLLIGVTATPNRTDAIGLGCVFQTIAYSYALKQAIEDGWLVPITPWVVETDISLDDVKITAGEFNQKDLAAAVNQERRNELALAAWQDHGEDRQTIAFTVDVAHAHDMAAVFQKAGIHAVAISGETPREDRRQALEAYRQRRIRAIMNCMVLTEGTDLPETGCILHGKPTKSATLYEQMTGRGLRLFEGKRDCLVIDIVDVARRHSLQTAPVLYGLPPGLLGQGKELDKLEAELAAFREEFPNLDLDALLKSGRLTLEQLRARASTFDIWKVPDMGTFAEVVSLNWIRHGTESFKLSYPWGEGSETLLVGPNLLGKFEISCTVREVLGGGDGGGTYPYARRHATGGPPAVQVSTRQRTLAQDLPDARSALQTAEAWVRAERRTAARLRDKEAPWRARPASAKQIDLLKKWRIPFQGQLNSGQASDLIDLARSRRR